MRRLALLAALAALACLVIARRRRLHAARLAPPPAPSGGLTPAPAAEPPAPADHVPTPTAPGSGFVSVAWTLVARPGEQAELAIRCHQDDELVLDRVDVQETPTQVFVTAIARRAPRAAADPPRAQASATVPLSRPLGERALIPTPVDPYA
jgi:hypothetical protein